MCFAIIQIRKKSTLQTLLFDYLALIAGMCQLAIFMVAQFYANAIACAVQIHKEKLMDLKLLGL